MSTQHTSKRFAKAVGQLRWYMKLTILAAAGCANTHEASPSDIAVAHDSALSAGSAAPLPANAASSPGIGAGLDSTCWFCPPGESPDTGGCRRASLDVCDNAPEPPPPPPPATKHDNCEKETTCDPDPNNPPSGCVFGFCANCALFATCADPNSTRYGIARRCADGPCSTWGL
jgi:hypothetical protein